MSDIAQYCVKSYVAVKPHFTRKLRNNFHMLKDTAEPLRKRLGRNLKFVLLRRDQSQRSAALAAKMNDKTFNNLAEARFDPRMTQVEKAANAVGYEVWQLLACEFAAMPAEPKEVLRLLELFSKASPQGRATILQVATTVNPAA
jgi:hypothetical protein